MTNQEVQYLARYINCFLSVHGEDSYPTKASCGQFPGIRPLLLTAAHALCECCACCELASDMENVMSGGSAACVKFQSWGKFLAFNRRCFVVNGLSVAILRCVKINMVGNIRNYWKTLGKNSQKLL